MPESASPEGDHQGLPQAGAPAPPRRQPRRRRGRGALQGDLGRLRRARRRGPSARSTTRSAGSARWRRASAAAVRAPAAGRRASRSWATAPTSATCSAGLFGRGGAADAAGRGEAPARSAAPTSRPSCTSRSPTPCRASPRRSTSPATRRARRATAPARRRAPRRRSARVCGGRGVLDDNQGLFSFSSAVPQLWRAGSCHRRPVPDLPRHGVERAPARGEGAHPAGVDDGQRIRLKGRGGPGRNGGPPGDLYVDRARSSRTRSSGARATTSRSTVPVTFPRPRSAHDIEVPTLDGGPVTLKVQPGTQPRLAAAPRQGPGRADRQAHRRPARHGRGRRARAADRGASARPSRRWREAIDRVAARPSGGVMAMADIASTSASTSSRWRPSWPACTRRRCASTSARVWSTRPAPAGGSRRYSDDDIDRLRRIHELTDRGPEPRGRQARARARGRDRATLREPARACASCSAQRAVDDAPPYRRDLVPVSQSSVRVRRA